MNEDPGRAVWNLPQCVGEVWVLATQDNDPSIRKASSLMLRLFETMPQVPVDLRSDCSRIPNACSGKKVPGGGDVAVPDVVQSAVVLEQRANALDANPLHSADSKQVASETLPLFLSQLRVRSGV